MRVRRFLGRYSLPPAAIRPHFFGACPKKRCRAAKERRFGACRNIDPVESTAQYTGHGGIVLTVPFAPGEGGRVQVWVSRAGAVPFAGGERYSLRLLCAVGQLSGRHCRFTPPPTTKSAFLWGSTPFLCARAKKWGGMGSRGRQLPTKVTAHPQKAQTSSLLLLPGAPRPTWAGLISSSTPPIWGRRAGRRRRRRRCRRCGGRFRGPCARARARSGAV